MSIEQTIHNMIVERLTPVAEAIGQLQEAKPEIDLSDLDQRITAAVDAAMAAKPVDVVECKGFDGETRRVDSAHPQLKTLLSMVSATPRSRDRNFYVYGEAGTGKTTLGFQVAEALGFDSDTQGTAMSKYDLLGFRLPTGEVVLPAFVRIWIDGGVIILDDNDRSDPKALTALNAATANGKLDLSHLGMGLVDRHDDCVIIVTGNTAMNGQDAKYSAASKQDSAFRDRFMFLKVTLDEAFETSIAANAQWCQRVQKIRHAARELGGNVDKAIEASMRATIQGAPLLQSMSQADVEECVILKGCGPDITSLLYGKAGKPSKAKGKIANYD
jgi:hypothetical protein